MKEKILKLRSEGKSFREIEKILGCSRGTISYHCGKGQKEKTQERTRKKRSKAHPFENKFYHFHDNYILSSNKKDIIQFKAIKLIYIKIISFHRDQKKMTTTPISFSVQDVIKKFEKNPRCYLTGDEIDINKPRTYEFDHIIPRSKGGQNTLENLGICTRQANRSKETMTPDEFINMCKRVVENNGFECKKIELLGLEPKLSD